MSNAVTAISVSSELIAVYIPTPSVSSSDSKQRLVVKVYDAKVSLGSLKFTLTTHRPASPSVTKLSVSRLFFCGAEDQYLVATLSSNTDGGSSSSVSQPVVVWDLKRGVVCHNVALPPNSVLCTAIGGQQQRHLYLLVKLPQDSKLVVYVHDLDTESHKLVRKVKIGSCEPSDDDDENNETFGMALHESQNSIAVRYGKRIKISSLTTNDAVRCKIKGSAVSNTNSDTDANTSVNSITFSDDGSVVIVTHSNGLLFYSTKDGKKTASAPIISSPSSSSIHNHAQRHLQVHNDTSTNTTQVIVVTEQAAARASLFHITPLNLTKDIKHFATITSPTTSTATTTTKQQTPKSLHRVYIPRGKRGRNTLLMLELSPRGTDGDADVHISEVPYRTTTDDNSDNQEDTTNTSSSLLQGELYPTDKTNDNDDQNTNTTQSQKKRKIGNIALGPGEAGAEAMNVSDSRSLLLLKKQKKSTDGTNDDDDNGEFDFLNEQDGNKEADDGTTIAERLALLSSELDRDSDDEDDETTPLNGAASPRSKPKVPITSDSLLTLLRQALTSNDDSQLETALQVSDKKMIKTSIDALCAESMSEDFSGTNLVMTLLSKLTTRLSRKAGRAERLSYWVSATLVSLISPSESSAMSDSWGGGGGGSSTLLEMGTTQMEIATHLGPLRNMLSERVDSLPSLLKLEGRLGLLGKLS